MTTFLDIKNLLKTKITERLQAVVANAAINYFESRITEQKAIKSNALKRGTEEQYFVRLQ